MATHTVAAGEVGTTAFALTASTVDTVTFTDNVASAEIISDGTAAVWYTNDGTPPAVDGAGSFYIPAVVAVASVELRNTQTADTIKINSDGTPTLRVQRAS